jgi:hypothetical protein
MYMYIVGILQLLVSIMYYGNGLDLGSRKKTIYMSTVSMPSRRRACRAQNVPNL